MRKNLTILLTILATYFVQSTLNAVLPAYYTMPDMLLILTCSFGLMRGKRAGMLTGFFSGLLFDLFHGTVFGLTALCLLYVGYVSGFLCKVFFDNDIRIPLVTVGVCEFAYQLVLLAAALFARRHISFGVYLTGTILPAVIAAMVCCIPLYYIYRLIHRSIAVYEEEAEQSPWLRR